MIAIFRLFFFLTLLGLFFLLFLGILSSQKRKSVRTRASSFWKLDDKLKQLLSQITENLIPIDIHELKILAWAKKVVKKTRHYEMGYLSTVFQENLISYLKMYHKKGRNNYMEAHTSYGKFNFMHSPSITNVAMDGKKLATIKDIYTYLPHGSSESFQIETQNGHQGTITNGSKELASFAFGREFSTNDRYFNYVNSVNENEIVHLVAITIYIILLNNNTST